MTNGFYVPTVEGKARYDLVGSTLVECIHLLQSNSGRRWEDLRREGFEIEKLGDMDPEEACQILKKWGAEDQSTPTEGFRLSTERRSSSDPDGQ
jgi:hypothetical protein